MELVYQTVPEGHPLLAPIRRIGRAGPLDLASGGWVAGGAALRLLGGLPWQPGSDLDLFCRDVEQAVALEAAARRTFQCPDDPFAARQAGNPRVMVPEERLVADGSPGYHRAVQIVRSQFYADVAELLADFDFTICRVATDGRTLVYDPQARADLEAGLLRPVTERRVRRTPERVVKYLRYGFAPTPGLLEWALALDRDKTTVSSQTLAVKGHWDGY